MSGFDEMDCIFSILMFFILLLCELFLISLMNDISNSKNVLASKGGLSYDRSCVVFGVCGKHCDSHRRSHRGCKSMCQVGSVCRL